MEENIVPISVDLVLNVLSLLFRNTFVDGPVLNNLKHKWTLRNHLDHTLVSFDS